MVALHTQTRFWLSTTEKIVVLAAIKKYCSDPNAVRRIDRSITNPSRETGRIIVSGDDGQTLVDALQTAIATIYAESQGRSQQTCQALQNVIARVQGRDCD